MKFKAEADGLKIGVNNSLTESLRTGNWGVRLSFTNNDDDGRMEVVLNHEEAKALINQIQEAIAVTKALKPILEG